MGLADLMRVVYKSAKPMLVSIAVGFATCALVMWELGSFFRPSGWMMMPIVAGLAVFALLLGLAADWVVRRTGYEIREKDLFACSGIFARSGRAFPLSKIKNVTAECGIYESLLGLKNVDVSGEAGFELSAPSLEARDADWLVHEIRKRT